MVLFVEDRAVITDTYTTGVGFLDLHCACGGRVQCLMFDVHA